MKLGKDDHIITAYAERASGPGWGNCPLWLIVRGPDGKLRQECLQPDEQSGDIAMLYNVSESVHLAMRHAVQTMAAKRRK